MAYGTESLDASLIPISSVYSKENNTFPALVGEPGAYQDANNNQSSAVVMSFLRPKVWQSAHNVTGSGGKTLTCAFPNNCIAGNSIVVCVGMGEVEGANITLTITDTLGNTYAEAVNASQSTTLEAAIFYATNIAAGANTITVTIAGSSSSNTAIAVQIYEVFGLISVPGALDQTNTGSNAGSTNVSTGAVVCAVPNELVFVAIAAAGGTITPGNNWTNDTGGTLSPVGGNLVSFVAQSRLHTQIVSLAPSATLSASNAWAAATATFKSVIGAVEGSFNMMQIGGQTPKLDNTNELGVSIYGKNSVAGDTPLGLDASGRITGIIQAVAGTALAADQSNTELRTSLYGKSTTAGDTALAVDSSGHIIIAQPTSATGTITSIAAATSSTQLLASNTSRKGMFVFNDSTAILYLAFAGSASTTAYTVQIPANSFFEMPTAPVYTGAIFGIWSAANGSARITELS